MYVCLCAGVTDSQIKAAILVRGARTLADLARECNGAGLGCGSCETDLKRLLRIHGGSERTKRGVTRSHGARSERG